MRSLLVVLLILLALLQYKLWLGEGGFTDVKRLEQRVAEQQQENDLLQQRNEELQAEVADLREGIEAIEVRGGEGIGGPEDGQGNNASGVDLDWGDELVADAEGGVEAAVQIGLFEVGARVVETQGLVGGAGEIGVEDRMLIGVAEELGEEGFGSRVLGVVDAKHPTSGEIHLVAGNDLGAHEP